ncbi:phosphopantetheine-binding protein [Caulobacter sp. KR2-114]|uniref:phosphopantetheine-binding protein n=1 Tax=Caulobacter sp. KR2-114 TaxID=3400912 RepID=UPI003C0BF53C
MRRDESLSLARQWVAEAAPEDLARRSLTGELDGSLLFTTGTLDSLRFLDVLASLEDSLGAELPDSELTPENFDTISAIAALAYRYGAKKSQEG